MNFLLKKDSLNNSMAREMNVVPYDAKWVELYEDEKNILLNIFGELLLDVQHFGSTSIIGMTAKPTIDIMTVVETIESVDAFNDAMRGSGYIVKGENGISGRRYFVRLKDDSENHASHVHIYEKGNPHITAELMFRDFLRINKDAFLKYEVMKKQVSEKYRFSPHEYEEAKTDCVMEIMEQARRYYQAKKLYGLKIICISASNRTDVKGTNSYWKCKAVLDEAGKHIPDMHGEIIELQNYALNPCTACSMCSASKRCAVDDAFNEIYEKIIACDVLCIVAPHYAPIPAKLCMLFEKMGQIAFSRDEAYQSETYGIRTAVITHGATAIDEDARKKKKRIINDPIANALHDPQLKLIPYSDEWDTGICVQPIEMNHDGETILKINEYVRKVIDSFL